ncbi:recombinase family protein [Caballeronia grimmiae]|uniref:recombinase family protein n=1 Tax=Caballeronia grimmiae TaxID=1071679 RepID=UPI0038BB791D
MQLCSIGELAKALGVAVVTLPRWHQSGRLLPACRTFGGQRRYDLVAIDKCTIAYARVSSHDQAEHLTTQAQRLDQHCRAQGYPVAVRDPEIRQPTSRRWRPNQRHCLARERTAVQR